MAKLHFNPAEIRQQFPLISQSDQIYLDSAATSQKPQAVIEAVANFYQSQNANVHRAAHQLSAAATAAFEAARETVRGFINADLVKEIIFTKGTTESINLVCQSYARTMLQPGDEILLTTAEHHANIVPWQLVAEQTGAVIKVIPLTEDQQLDMAAASNLLTANTKILAFGHVSNVTGVINPVKQLCAMARAVGAITLVDGAQAVGHLAVDVADLDCDFYAFSAHKMFGPTGIGVLYGKQALLEAMPPYQGGGEMIRRVSFDGTSFNQLPFKFEAGTPNIAGAIGLAAAIDFIQSLDRDALLDYEHQLMAYARQQLLTIEGVRLIADVKQKIALISFVFEDEHPSDLATLLDQQGLALRAGHHCAMPLMAQLGLPGTVRASFCVYNTKEEVDAFIAALKKACSFF